MNRYYIAYNIDDGSERIKSIFDNLDTTIVSKTICCVDCEYEELLEILKEITKFSKTSPVIISIDENRELSHSRFTEDGNQIITRFSLSKNQKDRNARKYYITHDILDGETKNRVEEFLLKIGAIKIADNTFCLLDTDDIDNFDLFVRFLDNIYKKSELSEEIFEISTNISVIGMERYNKIKHNSKLIRYI